MVFTDTLGRSYVAANRQNVFISIQDTYLLVKVNILEKFDGKFVYDEFTMHVCVLINKNFLNAIKTK